MTDNAKNSILPPMREIAEDLREGEDFDAICQMYDVSETTLANRLRYAGYGISGHSLQVEARQGAPLQSSAEGSFVTGGGWGGDYTGLPLEPVPHARRTRRRFLGLDWSTTPATGPLWEVV